MRAESLSLPVAAFAVASAIGAATAFLSFNVVDHGLLADTALLGRQWWRLLSAPLTATSHWQWVFSALGLAMAGAEIERRRGRGFFCLVVVTSLLFSCGLQIATFSQVSTYGVVGVGVALSVGVVVVALQDGRPLARPTALAALSAAATFAGAMFGPGFQVPTIIGGCVCGAALCAAWAPDKKRRRVVGFGIAIALVGVFGLAVQASHNHPGRVFGHAFRQAEKAIANDDTVAAQEAIDVALKAIPNAPSALVLQAKIRYRRSELDPALEDLRAAWRRSPTQEAPYELAEQMLASAGRTQEREHVIQRWRAAVATSALAFAAEARLMREHGDLVGARTKAGRAVARDPTSTAVLLVSAQIRYQLGDRASAAALVKRVANAASLPPRERAFISLVNGDATEALRLYSAAADAFPAAQSRLQPFRSIAENAAHR